MFKKLILITLASIACAGASAAQNVNEPKNLIAFNYGHNLPWGEEQESIIISQYDPIIRRVAADKGYDWRLISAIAYTESRFDHRVVSGAGAVGLMQVMPSVATDFKVPHSEMIDPLVNVTMGVGLLDRISKTLRFPSRISERDRLSIILAAYNCGLGRVLDARRLAVKYGENHNSWSVVSKYLVLLDDSEFYNDEVVRCGPFYDDRQTLGFVRKVLRHYDSYCLIAML
jgi:membrane-bound lytic murein transglycosylase F